MNYRDFLYGDWELPDYIEALVHTKEMMRLRNISQDVLPHFLLPCAIPNRFQHSMGVCHAANLVMAHNPCLGEYEKRLLLISALLHDAGNTPFSHVGERYLRTLNGCDGESFLGAILQGSESEKIIQENGLTVDEVVQCVTGNMKPLSDVLNGSLDIDNCDNVARYHYAATLGSAVEPSVFEIVTSFRFINNRWWLMPEQCLLDVDRWIHARNRVYTYIYTSLNVRSMLHRALQFAFEVGQLKLDFFLLDDSKAFEHLLTKCNPLTQRIARLLERWNFYEEACLVVQKDPSPLVISLSDNWQARARFADRIAKECNLPQVAVCVYAGKGREKRAITVPFVGIDPPFKEKTDKDHSAYRLGVYVDPQYAQKDNLTHIIKELCENT